MVDVRLASRTRKLDALPIETSRIHVVSPGDIITEDTGYMRGHGTYVEDDKLKASVAGVVERVNKLICVKPLKTRYNGEVGDVVVGRITEVGQRRWKVETYSRMDSVLLLSSVNLPGGELRRKSVKDELMMREFFAEGDLISAEVQSLFADGSLSLHTRSARYGKLLEGTLVTVPPSLVKRCKTHFHNLPCGASIILGNNGYVWIGPLVEKTGEDDDEPMPQEASSADREVMARLRNCISALADHGCLLFDTSVLLAYDTSLKYQAKEILKPEVQEEIVDITRKTLLLQES